MKVKALFVVEDDPDIRLFVQMAFNVAPDFKLGGVATDALAALKQVHTHPPDLILLDHRLEGPITGLEIAPRLKAAAPDCKIILFTASEELREAAFDSPAIDAFLLKTKILDLVPLARRVAGVPAR